jgi:hypothetical protein
VPGEFGAAVPEPHHIEPPSVVTLRDRLRPQTGGVRPQVRGDLRTIRRQILRPDDLPHQRLARGDAVEGLRRRQLDDVPLQVEEGEDVVVGQDCRAGSTSEINRRTSATCSTVAITAPPG